MQDIAQVTGEQVEFAVTGGETELDRAILESLAEPLTHLLPNAVSHGIEPPDERRRAGKERGRLELRAVPGQPGGDQRQRRRPGHRGRHRRGGGTGGVVTAGLARPGYSTAAEVADVSGRGVGLDAVQCYARSVGGAWPCRASRARASKPPWCCRLALAQLEVLLVRRGPDVYGIPIAAVAEVVLVTGTQSVPGRPAVAVRGRPVPRADIAAVLGLAAPGLPEGPAAFIVSAGGRRVAIPCDRLIGAEEVVR